MRLDSALAACESIANKSGDGSTKPATASPSDCAQWEVKIGDPFSAAGGGTPRNTPEKLDAGWEPFAWYGYVAVRRCSPCSGRNPSVTSIA